MPNEITVNLPCKIGDTVWGVRNFNGRKLVLSGKVYQMFFGDDMRLCISIKGVCRGEWGKKIFATQEEAEKAIKEGLDNGTP